MKEEGMGMEEKWQQFSYLNTVTSFFFFLICQVKAGCEVDSLETSAVL